MEMTFNDMPWHDSKLLEIAIDRRNPGNNDEVIIKIRWPDSGENTFVFTDCYGFEARMNFGVIAMESIREASVKDESQELTEIRKKWASMGVDLRQLKCFEIETNSTGSLLRIYAPGYSVH